MTEFWQRALGIVAPAAPREPTPLDAWWAPPPAPPAVPEPAQPAPASAPPSARQQGRCPECGSGDYFRPTPETKARCYTCGYPVRHTTSGMTATDSTPTNASRQVSTGGYQPGKIIGRVE